MFLSLNCVVIETTISPSLSGATQDSGQEPEHNMKAEQDQILEELKGRHNLGPRMGALDGDLLG